MDRILNTSDKRAPRTGEILAVGARAAWRAGSARADGPASGGTVGSE